MVNIYETNHIWLGISSRYKWKKYVKMNKTLIDIVEKESENDFKVIQDYVIEKTDYLTNLEIVEGGFCRKSSNNRRESEKSQLRWKTSIEGKSDDWVPSNFLNYLNKDIYHNKYTERDSKRIIEEYRRTEDFIDYYHRRNTCKRINHYVFDGDGIELCNGYGNTWCTEVFTDNELKEIGNLIKNFIKDKYDLNLELKIRKNKKKLNCSNIAYGN